MKKALVKRIYLSILAVVVASVVVTLGVLFYADQLRTTFQAEITDTLGEVTKQGASALTRQVKNGLSALKDVSLFIGRQQGVHNTRETLSYLHVIAKNNDFVRMGVILPDGSCETTDGNKINLSDRDYFHRSMKGESVVSNLLESRSDGRGIIVLSVPVYEGASVIGVLFGSHETDDYRNSVSVNFFGGEGYSYIVRRNGDRVVDSSSPQSFKNLNNVFVSLQDTNPENAEEAAILEAAMQSGESGYIVFKNLIDKYMYFEPCEINDWYLLTVISTNVVNQKMDAVMSWTYLLCVLIIGLFLLLLLVVMTSEAHHRRVVETIAYVDRLTGYMSYEKFRIEADDILRRQNRTHYAIVALDLDKFRFINDLFGYPEGNNIIIFIADVLHNSLSPGNGEIFAHRNADWFVLLMQRGKANELAERLDEICEKIRACRSATGKQYDLRPSAGVYELEAERLSMNAMVDRAELAQKAVKKNRTRMVAFYDEKIRSRQLTDQKIEDRMIDALADDEFVVYYQPKYNVVTQKISGAEALVRWREGNGNILSPNDFIPLFEANGFITELDKYVFVQVCRTMRSWLDAGETVVPVSVNLSRVHLYSPDFVDEYRAIMDSYSIPKGLVQLELTESALFSNRKTMITLLDRLHDMGFDILMDDFGTGYSSLTMLKDVPINVLKLDKAFIDGLVDEKGRSVLKSIVGLAHELCIPVVAEGVETETQFDYLKIVGCDEIQGYYFARPMPGANFERLLKFGECRHVGKNVNKET